MDTVLHVDGMMCTHCKAAVEKALCALEGVSAAEADLQAKLVTVSGTASVDAMKQAIIAAGITVKE